MRKTSFEALAFLFVQLAATERAGIPRGEAFEVMRRDHDFGRRGQVFDALAEAVASGATLSAAMQRLPEVFRPETVELVRRGEEGGKLAGVLELLADDFARCAATVRAFRGVLVYPLALVAMMAIVVGTIMIFVVPAYKEVFTGFDSDLPLLTQLLVTISDLLVGYWFIWIALALAATVLVAIRRKAPAGNWFDRLLIRIPVIRGYLRKQFAARFAGVLQRSLEGGISLADVAAHLRGTAENAAVAGWLATLEERLRRGEKPHEAIKAIPELPRRLALVLELGGRTGGLASVLRQSVALSEVEAEYSMVMMQRAINWTTYAALGGMIGLTVIAIYLPIFKLGAAV